MITASLHTNGDDAFLAWRMPVTPGCWGVAIYREVRRQGSVESAGYLHNRVGFEADNPKPGETRPSSDWPFQRYTWTDHSVLEGDEVTYWVMPVMLRDGWLEVAEDQAAQAGPALVTANAGQATAYFNRGVVLSQFMLRRLPKGWSTAPRIEKLAALNKLKKDLESSDSSLRRFLMGDLGAALTRVLREEAAAGSEVHAVLYELSDSALINALARFSGRAHVVLANGSAQNSRKPRTPKPYEDGNAEAADSLTGEIDLRRRMFFSSQGLGHNKFMVISRNGVPKAVWTGSTNWATTGLCTQANNAVLIEDPALAKLYLEQWQRLADDVDHVPERGVDAPLFGPNLLAGNNRVHTCSHHGIRSQVWFTRTENRAELDEVVGLINSAEHAIFFLLFAPGTSSPVVAALNHRLGTTDLHIHGVINTIKAPDPNAPEGGGEVEVAVVSPAKSSRSFRLDIIQPEGVEHSLSSWATEVTRRDFIIGSGGVIGHAIVHSKVLVIDPFTKPVVVTGSHNFSTRASEFNDENLLVRVGDGQLAERYAVHIMGVYQHYRWRQYLHDSRAKHRKPWDHLTAGENWQSKLTDRRQRELAVWLG